VFCIFVKVKTFCFFIVEVKPTLPLLCVCVHSAWKGRPRNDLYCVGRDVKPYSLTHCTPWANKNVAQVTVELMA